MRHPEFVVVGGVSGSGKSTIGSFVAQRLGVPFIDADSLHSDANVTTMSAGIPLTDDDRASWLVRIGEVMVQHRDKGLVVACSALRRRYRDTIRAFVPSAYFLTLTGSRAVLAERISGRRGHFMPGALLDSQLAAFEPLESDESGADIDIDAYVETIVDEALNALRHRPE